MNWWAVVERMSRGRKSFFAGLPGHGCRQSKEITRLFDQMACLNQEFLLPALKEPDPIRMGRGELQLKKAL
jgi:hypothetical protein